MNKIDKLIGLCEELNRPANKEEWRKMVKSFENGLQKIFKVPFVTKPTAENSYMEGKYLFLFEPKVPAKTTHGGGIPALNGLLAGRLTDAGYVEVARMIAKVTGHQVPSEGDITFIRKAPHIRVRPSGPVGYEATVSFDR